VILRWVFYIIVQYWHTIISYERKKKPATVQVLSPMQCWVVVSCILFY